MKLPPHKTNDDHRAERASVLIIVMWVAIGLIAITLYFANSMTLELRAADNRSSGLVADQAIEGAARYVSYVLANYATNGSFPTNAQFTCQNMVIGDAHVWIIGRDESAMASTPTATDPTFGLIDEASKLNLNTVGSNTLAALLDENYDLADAIVDWRSTNSTLDLNYGSLGYEAKHDPFETVDELRLVYGMTMDILVGDDLNQNGILDGNEKSLTGGTSSTPGLAEYTTVYSRESNVNSEGDSLTNVNAGAQIQPLLESSFGSSRATQIMERLGYASPTSRAPATPIASLLQFYMRSGLSADDYGQIADDLTVTTNQYVYGRVNINTADEAVLTALFEGANIDEGTAQSAADTLINYRTQNPNNINNISWFVTALGQNSSVVSAMATRDRLTTKSFQFTADIAAVGPYGRGYRRVKFVFDLTDGTPKIIYRQDLSRLGWALGPKVRETLLAQNTQ